MQFVDAVFRTLSTGGNVLLPTDTAGRVLELALCLDLEWGKLLQSPQFTGRGVVTPLLYIVSNAGARTVRHRCSSSSCSWCAVTPDLCAPCGSRPVALVFALQFEFAKTLVEWLNDRWSKQFDVDKSVPYAFR